MKHPVYAAFDDFSNILKKTSFSSTSIYASGFHFSFIPFLVNCSTARLAFFFSNSLLTSVFEHFRSVPAEFSGLIIPQKNLTDSPYGFASSSHLRSGLLSSFVLFNDNYHSVVGNHSLENELISFDKNLNCFSIKNDVDYDSVLAFVESSGYHRCDYVSAPGEYSVRGMVLDVFSFSEKNPLRISFFNSPADLSCFSIETQSFLYKVPLYKIFSCKNFSSSVSFSEFIKNKFLSVHVNNDVAVFGKHPHLLNFDFNITCVEYGQYLDSQNSYNKVSSSEFLVNSALSYKTSLLVPVSFLKKTTPAVYSSANSLVSNASIGDFFVHRNFGVGVFSGMRIDKTREGRRESLILKYQNNEYIYVSIENLYLVSFFASSLVENIRVGSLSKGDSWVRRVTSIKKNLSLVVDSLLLAYSERSLLYREPYRFDKRELTDFISLFPFVETRDQHLSWNDILQDFSLDKPMDRLLCGDVGFGKTEIAMRSAFVVASCYYQVAIVSPTTILALQLYVAFNKRFKNTPINVSLLSRLQNKKEKTFVIDGLKKGSIDVIIGTHAIFSKNIIFKSLGLLVLDEEHRFGVKQKELLRSLAKSLDILSMSATPIPRSLQQAFNGMRNVSYLLTPPLMRLPIKTFVKFSNDQIYRSALLYEVKRGGQSFIVYNNVNNIDIFTQKISTLLPQVCVDYIHGQLSSNKIESVISSFINKTIDVLVCSTIIEAGIDVPQANTIIIENSHLLGLSQLYQLRGRVGRSAVQSYAYLLVPNKYKLKDLGRKRLKSIEKNTSLGSGLNISKLDLNLRGAGSLFGYKQSGNVSFVGKELYSLLIKESLGISMKKNGLKHESIDDVFVDLFNDCYIPEEYICSQSVRFDLYKKVFSLGTLDAIKNLKDDVCGWYGPPPHSVNNLLKTQRVRVSCLGCRVFKVFCSGVFLCFHFYRDVVERRLFFEKTATYFSGLGFTFKFKEDAEFFLKLRVNVLNKASSYKIVLDYLNKIRV